MDLKHKKILEEWISLYGKAWNKDFAPHYDPGALNRLIEDVVVSIQADLQETDPARRKGLFDALMVAVRHNDLSEIFRDRGLAADCFIGSIIGRIFSNEYPYALICMSQDPFIELLNACLHSKSGRISKIATEGFLHVFSPTETLSRGWLSAALHTCMRKLDPLYQPSSSPFFLNATVALPNDGGALQFQITRNKANFLIVQKRDAEGRILEAYPLRFGILDIHLDDANSTVVAKDLTPTFVPGNQPTVLFRMNVSAGDGMEAVGERIQSIMRYAGYISLEKKAPSPLSIGLVRAVHKIGGLFC